MPDGDGAPVLELQDVCKRYRAGDVVVDALRGVTLVVRAGEFVAMVGESGSGKTTLLGIMGCLDRPSEGSYRLVGQEVATLPETPRARVLAALAEVGLAERTGHRPNQLSGGRQQRVAIARALVARPSVVLADEPTGNLDSESAADVLAILDRLHAGGATLVLVTHSQEVAARASRIVRVADGRIVTDEPTAA